MIPENRHRKVARIYKAREVYKGRIFSFVIENVSLPNDRQVEMAFVRHPGSTAIVPLLDAVLKQLLNMSIVVPVHADGIGKVQQRAPAE